MSGSIPSPWLASYLVDVAETYGCNLPSIPVRPKGGRVQLIKFLTYLEADNDDASIWAVVSDKVHKMPIRFSKEALQEFRNGPGFAGKSLTEHKTAFILIKKLRPFFTRIPLGGEKGMTPRARLALDVGYVHIVGSINDSIWGEPKDIETQKELSEWVEGLQESGGGGNVLKLRKEAQAQALDISGQPARNSEEKTKKAVRQQLRLKPQTGKARISGARKTADQKAASVSSEHSKGSVSAVEKTEAAPLKAWRARWRHRRSDLDSLLTPNDVWEAWRMMPVDAGGEHDHSDTPNFLVQNRESRSTLLSPVANFPTTPKPKDARPNPLDLSDNTPVASSRDASQVCEHVPATPSNWSPSIRGSPGGLGILGAYSHPVEEMPQSQVGSPHPEDSPQIPLMDIEGGLYARTEIVDCHTQCEDRSPALKIARSGSDSEVDQSHSASYFSPRSTERSCSDHEPSSPSFLVNSSAALVALSTTSTSTSLRHPYPGVLRPLVGGRRVPLPVCGHLSPDPDVSGPGRILVPNSDTSGSMSQSQPLSQPLRTDPSSSRNPSQSQHPSHQSLSYTSQSQGHSQSQTGLQSEGQSQLRNELRPPTPIVEPQPCPSPKDVISMTAQATSKSNTQCAAIVDPDQPSEEKAQQLGDGEHTILPLDESLEAISHTGAGAFSTPPPHITGDSGSETEDEHADDERDLEGTASEDSSGSDEDAPLSGSGDLESDDARTKQLVDRYAQYTRNHPRSVSPGDTSRNPPANTENGMEYLSGAAENPPRKLRSQRLTRLPTSFSQSQSSDGPLPPSSPDVFMSEESFRASHSITSPRPHRASSSRATQSTPSLSSDSEGTGHRTDLKPSGGTVSGSSTVLKAQMKPVVEVSITHDADAWSKPTFMRRKGDVNRKENTAGETRGVTPRGQIEDELPIRRKRVVSSTPSPEPMERPAKKRKIPEPVSAISTAQISNGISRQIDERVADMQPRKDKNAPVHGDISQEGDTRRSTKSVVPQIDLRRSSSIPSPIASTVKKRKRSADADTIQTSNPKSKTQLIRNQSLGISSLIGAKHSDFRTEPGSSSVSTVRKLVGSQGSHTTIGGQNLRLPVGSARGRSGSLQSNGAEALRADEAISRRRSAHLHNDPTLTFADAPVASSTNPPTAYTAAGRIMSQEWILNPKQATSERRDGPAARSRSSAMHRVIRKSTSVENNALSASGHKLLGGYEVSFTMRKEQDGPPLVTWKELENILLRTGRKREQERKKAEESRGRAPR